MKVLFLDIDGVLNHEKHYMWLTETNEATPLQRVYPYCEFNPSSIKELNRVIDTTGAKLVVSSSWRLDGIVKLNNIFKHVGIYHKIFDITPCLNINRGKEIDEWLNNHTGVTKYVIIDDDTDMEEHQMNHFVKTNAYDDGLNKLCADKAIEILNN
jgi:hypothetical protein